MSNQESPDQSIDILVSTHQPDKASLKAYVIGFVGSIILTLSAYLMVRYAQIDKPIMIGILAVLALTQFIVQLVYFLHIGQEFSPRLKLIVLTFMIAIVFILVAGSLWIMSSLNGRMMMSTKQMEEYMNQQDF